MRLHSGPAFRTLGLPAILLLANGAGCSRPAPGSRPTTDRVLEHPHVVGGVVRGVESGWGQTVAYSRICFE